MAAKTLVAFQTHLFGRQLRNAFLSLSKSLPASYEAVVLVHLPPGAPVPPLLQTVPHHLVRTPEMRIPEYGAKSGCGTAEWSLWNGGHTDLTFLHLAAARPGYDRYWSVEYDVRFTGKWGAFFSHFEDNPADLLASNVRTAQDDPRWYFWNTLVRPDPADAISDSDRICSFMPVFRVSRRMVETVDQAYRSGWTGHSEAIWPTVARRAGLAIEDLGGNGDFVSPGNRGRFYESSPTTWNMAPGTMVYRPIKHLCLRRNMLWHPIKPLRETLLEDVQRVQRASRRVLRTVRARFRNTAQA